jgi:hypothetical protein
VVGLSCADVGSGFWNNHASDSGRLGKRACEMVWLTAFGVALLCNIKITCLKIYSCVQRVSATILSTLSLRSSRNGLSSNLASDKSRMYSTTFGGVAYLTVYISGVQLQRQPYENCPGSFINMAQCQRYSRAR